MIFVGFRRVIGRDDIEGIEEYLKTHPDFDVIYIVHKEPLTDVVKSLIEERGYKEIRTDNLKGTLKKLRAEGKTKEFFLDDFGKRKLRNPCGRSLSRPQIW